MGNDEIELELFAESRSFVNRVNRVNDQVRKISNVKTEQDEISGLEKIGWEKHSGNTHW